MKQASIQEIGFIQTIYENHKKIGLKDYRNVPAYSEVFYFTV
jgi:hypothetical protein